MFLVLVFLLPPHCCSSFHLFVPLFYNIRYLNVHSTSCCISVQLHNDSVFSKVQTAFYLQTIKWCIGCTLYSWHLVCTSMQILNNKLLTLIFNRGQGDFPYLWPYRKKYLLLWYIWYILHMYCTLKKIFKYKFEYV